MEQEANLWCGTSCKGCREPDTSGQVEEEEVRLALVFPSATDLPFTVTGVNQQVGVALGEGVAGNTKPHLRTEIHYS